MCLCLCVCLWVYILVYVWVLVCVCLCLCVYLCMCVHGIFVCVLVYLEGHFFSGKCFTSMDLRALFWVRLPQYYVSVNGVTPRVESSSPKDPPPFQECGSAPWFLSPISFEKESSLPLKTFLFWNSLKPREKLQRTRTESCTKSSCVYFIQLLVFCRRSVLFLNLPSL